MTFEEEMKALEDKLRGIKGHPYEGRGHQFKRSALSKKLQGKSTKAPKKVYEENMKNESGKFQSS